MKLDPLQIEAFIIQNLWTIRQGLLSYIPLRDPDFN